MFIRLGSLVEGVFLRFERQAQLAAGLLQRRDQGPQQSGAQMFQLEAHDGSSSIWITKASG